MKTRTWQRVLAGLTLAGAVAFAQERPRLDRDRLPEIEPAPDYQPEAVVAPAPDQAPTRIRPNLRDDELTETQRARVAANEQRLPPKAALEPAQREEVRNELRVFAKTNGNDKVVRDTVQTAVKNGCTGQCLADALKSLNRAREQGVPDKEAAQLVNETVTALRRERGKTKEPLTAEQQGERLQARIDERLAARAAKKAAKKGERGIGGSGPDEQPKKRR